MTKLKDVFTAAVQGTKDTINGFSFNSFMGWLHAGATGFMTYQTVGLFLAAGISVPFVISGVFAGAGLYSAHQNGKTRRLMGYPPRYIK